MKWIALLAAGLILTGCSKQDAETPETEKPVVYAVNYPLAYFAERIAGDAVTAVFPEMEGDPAFWEPAAEQVAAFQAADLILLNGASYAKWITKVSLPQSRMLNTADGLEDRFIALGGTVTHTHGPGGAHAHGDLAFTLWLNPELAAHQATAVYTALSDKWGIERGGLEMLLEDLRELDQSFARAFEKLGDQPLLGSHPVYQYLAQRYSLDMKSVHWEPDAAPDTAMWRELDDVLEAHEAKIMLWEDEPLPEVKARLAEQGIQSVVFNPCGNRSDEGDYMDVMKQNAASIMKQP